MADVPEGTSAIDCNLVGRVIRDQGVGVVIPKPGTGVGGAGLSITGDGDELTVEVASDGTISYPETRQESATSTAGAADPGTTSASAIDACSDTANSRTGHAEWGTYNWYVGDGGMPGALTQTSAATAFADAINNITGSYNDCGLADEVGASSNYQGSTSYESDMTSSATCTEEDGKSTWDAGDLPSNFVAYNCWHYWVASYDLYESDVRYNTTDHDFTNDVTSSCSNKFDIRSVGTHEAGHTFGLGHATGTDHSNLTMYESSWRCSESARTLGYGDVLGLRGIY
ncbi:matrixin family metalloprotease [Streptomyces cavernicola]|uniref:Peptidase M10 n=1 Tax=Streptomyces cavernicola TaxID=3043613 RepID=A0ABT6SJS8_9ACTN|nr:matrixin family metalloprotease [Streptomyces sp. B-S-A6]MDI3408299.1 peptidase M10 [Streptomyces sp. B-S-A6]